MFVSKRQDCLRAASFTFYKDKNRNLSFSLLECFADRFWHRYCFSLLLSAAVFKLLKPRQAQLCHSEGDVMCCYVVFEIMGPVSKLTCLAEKQHLLKTTQSENCCGFNNKRQKTAAQMEQRCFRLWNKQPWKACSTSAHSSELNTCNIWGRSAFRFKLCVLTFDLQQCF